MVNIHPARAGVNLVLVDFDDLDVYLPRMRGGSTLCRTFIGVPSKIHPACAGVNPRSWRRLTARKNSPRTRGGQP